MEIWSRGLEVVNELRLHPDGRPIGGRPGAEANSSKNLVQTLVIVPIRRRREMEIQDSATLIDVVLGDQMEPANLVGHRKGGSKEFHWRRREVRLSPSGGHAAIPRCGAALRSRRWALSQESRTG